MEQSKLSARINKIKGQINGIEKMIEEKRDCSEVIVQIQAARASLASLGEKLIENEAMCCVDNSSEPAQQVVRLKTLVKDLFKLS